MQNHYMCCSQRGPNKVPIYSMVVVAIVTVTFIIIGDINQLAPIVTMPFLITYASIDYSYFALAQTFDLQHRREMRYVFTLLYFYFVIHVCARFINILQRSQGFHRYSHID